MTNPTSNLVAELKAWMATDAGRKFACVRNYPYVDKKHDAHCEGCLIVASLKALERLPVETACRISKAHAKRILQDWIEDDAHAESLRHWPDLRAAYEALHAIAESSSVEPTPSQPQDTRGDAALWVLAWLTMKGGLGSDVHEVIEAVMAGRAEMRPNNKLHIETRSAEKASCAHEAVDAFSGRCVACSEKVLPTKCDI